MPFPLQNRIINLFDQVSGLVLNVTDRFSHRMPGELISRHGLIFGYLTGPFAAGFRVEPFHDGFRLNNQRPAAVNVHQPFVAFGCDNDKAFVVVLFVVWRFTDGGEENGFTSSW